jgi:hypothetical protein
MELSDLTDWGIVKVDDKLWGEFNQWSNAGFTIVKGSKASVIDKKLKFNHHQVRKYTPPKYQGNATLSPHLYGANGHWDNDSDYDSYEHY